MSNYNVRPKKHLGQHFLIDVNIAIDTVEQISGVENLLEIGPGMGILTREILALNIPNFYVIEIDLQSIDYLNKHFPELQPRIVHDDFLTFDTSSLFGDAQFSIIGNFPYNISSQILFKVLELKNRVSSLVGMFQKEVALRICSPPGNKNYGILSVLMQAYYNTEYLFTVGSHVFNPPPKVQSAVVKFTRNGVEKLQCDEVLFKRIIKTGFNQRRKTLHNALKTMELSNLPAKFESKRAEQLSVEDFMEITLLNQG
ncbi:MAG: 16S rRNA (adenine(1518)-N(6)/adenine(1519)-N(6))-dimethyltransferase RsmA [Bacteroidota bacterium]